MPIGGQFLERILALDGQIHPERRRTPPNSLERHRTTRRAGAAPTDWVMRRGLPGVTTG